MVSGIRAACRGREITCIDVPVNRLPGFQSTIGDDPITSTWLHHCTRAQSDRGLRAGEVTVLAVDNPVIVVNAQDSARSGAACTRKNIRIERFFDGRARRHVARHRHQFPSVGNQFSTVATRKLQRLDLVGRVVVDGYKFLVNLDVFCHPRQRGFPRSDRFQGGSSRVVWRCRSGHRDRYRRPRQGYRMPRPPRFVKHPHHCFGCTRISAQPRRARYVPPGNWLALPADR